MSRCIICSNCFCKYLYYIFIWVGFKIDKIWATLGGNYVDTWRLLQCFSRNIKKWIIIFCTTGMVPNMIGYVYQKRELRVPADECGPFIFVANQIQFIFQLAENDKIGPNYFLIGDKMAKWKQKVYRLCPICDQEQDGTCRYCT